MRLRFLRAALVDFARRWGAYAAVAALLFSAGSNAPLAAAASLAAVAVAPLVRSAAHAPWIVAAVLGYAVVGAVPVVLTRPLWWPRHWAEAERSLPLAHATLRRSDRVFAGLVELPWQAVLVVGCFGVGTSGVHFRTGAAVVGAWLVSAAGSLVLGAAWMRQVRRRSVPASGRRMRATAIARGDDRGAIGPVRALVLLPMLRGRAPRTAIALGLGTFATSACAAGPLRSTVDAGWPLAALAVVAIVATTVLRASTVVELRPLWSEQRQWPIDVRRCERARTVVALLPMLASLSIGVVCALAAPRTRPVAVAVFAAVVAGACAIEATSGDAMKPGDRAARWLLFVAIAVAVASEVCARAAT